MSYGIKFYIRYVIFKKNGVGVLPHWVFCPTLPYVCVCEYVDQSRFC